MKITCIKCGKKVTGMKGLQNHLKIRHTAPYGNRRNPDITKTPPAPSSEKKVKADVSTSSTHKSAYVTYQQFTGLKKEIYDPREVAEYPTKWIPPPEARQKKN